MQLCCTKVLKSNFYLLAASPLSNNFALTKLIYENFKSVPAGIGPIICQTDCAIPKNDLIDNSWSVKVERRTA